MRLRNRHRLVALVVPALVIGCGSNPAAPANDDRTVRERFRGISEELDGVSGSRRRQPRTRGIRMRGSRRAGSIAAARDADGSTELKGSTYQRQCA